MVLAYDTNDFFTVHKITTRVQASIDATPMDYAMSIDSEVGKGLTYSLFLRAFHLFIESGVRGSHPESLGSLAQWTLCQHHHLQLSQCSNSSLSSLLSSGYFPARKLLLTPSQRRLALIGHSKTYNL